MRHPNFPTRKIRHAKTLVAAGFQIDQDWMKLNAKASVVSNVAKLIYWKHPKFECQVVLHDYEAISMAALVERVYAQAAYHTKQSASVVWKDPK